MSDELATLAKTLIDENGRDVTLHLKAEAAADAQRPWLGSREQPDEHPGDVIGPYKAVFVSERESEFTKLIEAVSSGTTGPRRGRQSFLLSGLDLEDTEPELIDTLIDGGREWRVTDVDIVRPGETTYLVTLEVEQ